MQLTDEQWTLLKVHEDHNYVAAVRGDVVRQYPALADDPTLRDRLNTAFARTKELGFTHNAPILDYLYVESITPEFYNIPAVAAWLEKPGLSGEQRFKMLMQATRKKQQEMKENS